MTEKTPTKCIIILSTRSAGSTALYGFLTGLSRCHGVNSREDIEGELKDETAYWANAAALLGKRLEHAGGGLELTDYRQNLCHCLSRNLGTGYIPPKDDQELIFGGWRSLCEKLGPVFVEKSPHHLYQWSAVEAIIENIRRSTDIEHHIVGLVRNPVSSNYSQWKRWGYSPEEMEREWMLAYGNLRKLRSALPSVVETIRYEDLVTDPRTALSSVMAYAGIESDPEKHFKPGSLTKWRNDPAFDFYRPAKETVAFARENFGYTDEDLHVDRFRITRRWTNQTRYLFDDGTRRLRSAFRKPRRLLPSRIVGTSPHNE